MHPSDRLRQLLRRLTRLKAQYLPEPSDTGTYSARQYDDVRALLLMAHAEIEAYLEDVAGDVVTITTSRWSQELPKIPRTVLLGVLAYAAAASTEPNVAPGTTESSLGNAVKKAGTAHHSRLTRNNGIRQKNLYTMLLPVGLREDELDPQWVALMDNFGSIRGRLAHQADAAQAPPDPQDARRDLGRIVAGLVALDRRLTEIAGE